MKALVRVLLVLMLLLSIFLTVWAFAPEIGWVTGVPLWGEIIGTTFFAAVGAFSFGLTCFLIKEEW